jgi:hypothetical protein
MHKQLFLLIFASIILIGRPLHAQDRDLGLHLEADISKKVSTKIEFQFSEELRFNQSMTAFDRSLATLSGIYTFNKFLKAGLFYTWIYANNQDDGYYESRNRFGGWIQGSYKISRFRFSLREKFQNTYRDEDLGNYRYNPKMYLRSRFEASYNIRKMPLKPYFSAEMFYQLNNPYGNDVDKWRLTLGSDWALSKKFAVSPFIRSDREIHVKNPVNTFIIGAAFKFDL